MWEEFIQIFKSNKINKNIELDNVKIKEILLKLENNFKNVFDHLKNENEVIRLIYINNYDSKLFKILIKYWLDNSECDFPFILNFCYSKEDAKLIADKCIKFIITTLRVKINNNKIKDFIKKYFEFKDLRQQQLIGLNIGMNL